MSNDRHRHAFLGGAGATVALAACKPKREEEDK
jgi:hypothetical protein